MEHVLINTLLLGLTIGVGAIAAYFKAHALLAQKAVEYIAQAEVVYKDATQAGGQKFQWVVNQLYKQVPLPLQAFITREMVAQLVQKTFDGVAAYASTKLDKAAAAVPATPAHSQILS